MDTPVPDQAYIDSLIEAIQTEGLSHERLCPLLFAIVEQYCANLPSHQGAGRHKRYSDSVILKLDMLMHLTGKCGETEILREAQRYYRAYFPQLPGQGRLWHRIRAALPLLEGLRQELKVRLGVAYEDLRILDTLPLPVAQPHQRPGRGNGFDWADGGHCASKHLSYFGFKLGVLMTPQGIPDVYELFSARPHDVKTLDDLLDEAQEVIVLGDKGFISDPQREKLAEEQHVLLVTYRRHNQKQQNSPMEQWTLHTFRHLIETVFSQWDGHMHLEHLGAKTDMGLMKRVAGVMTAFTMGIYLNALLGRDLLAIKALFA